MAGMGYVKDRWTEAMQPTPQEWDRRWIPVSERLPEPFVPVLAWFASPVTRKLKYAEVTHRGLAGDWQHSQQFDKPTHWMPLPEPPEVK
jgi:hypothetical protein